MTLQSNLPRVVGKALRGWVPFLSACPRHEMRGILAYLPNPEVNKLPVQVKIPTGLKINGKPVSFIAGGAKHGGRLVGAGLIVKGSEQQVWRTDHHSFHGLKHNTTSYAGKDEVSVWQDNGYHFHVNKPKEIK